MTNKIKSLMFTSKSYSIIFLILTFTFIIFKLNIGSLDKSGWFIGDWLINYSDGGFKRRGLAGNLFFLLQNTRELNRIQTINRTNLEFANLQ